MNSAVKLIIGLLILIAGLVWYLGSFIWPNSFTLQAFQYLKIVFYGVFGLFLIFLGLIIAWIEYEDLKWEAREKKEKEAAPPPVVEQPPAKGKKK